MPANQIRIVVFAKLKSLCLRISWGLLRRRLPALTHDRKVSGNTKAAFANINGYTKGMPEAIQPPSMCALAFFVRMTAYRLRVTPKKARFFSLNISMRHIFRCHEL
jgi:hypothetical protein